MKKNAHFSIILLAGLLIFTVTASAGSILDNIRKKGELRIGTTGQQPPMTVTTKSGEIVGLDADIAKTMAAAMGVRVKFVVTPFNDLLPALKTGRTDMVISSFTMTPERNLDVAFVGPYHVSGKGILTNGDRFAVLQKANGLNSPEVKIAALKNSTSQAFAEQLMPKAKLTLTESYQEAITLLFESKLDVLIADYQFCAFTAYRYQDKGLSAGKSPLTFEPLGIAMKEDPLLINWVQNFLLLIHGNGELKKMESKWLNGGKWVDELP